MRVVGQRRHEGGRHRPLADEPSQQVGDPERDEVGVAGGAGAEDLREKVVPEVPRDAAEEREEGHDARGADDLLV